MKIIQREIIKVVPGKMGEATDLFQKHAAAATRLGCPSMRIYRPLIGNEFFHTVFSEAEWDSMAAMETFYEKMMGDSEMQAYMAKWEAILESHVMELYTPMQ